MCDKLLFITLYNNNNNKQASLTSKQCLLLQDKQHKVFNVCERVSISDEYFTPEITCSDRVENLTPES